MYRNFNVNNIIIILFLCCYGTCKDLQLQEGSSCTWQGINGRCVNEFRCLSAVKHLQNNEDPPICSYKDDVPIICCTDCELVNDTRLLLVNAHLGILKKTGVSKAKDKCVEFINSLFYPCKEHSFAVFEKNLNSEKNCYEPKMHLEFWSYAAEGGRDAERSEYPHMALLGYGDDVDSADWLCGGSVISDRFILTAAHCISTPALGQVKYVALGILKRTDPSELWRRYNVSRIIPHPAYKPPSKYHDIALLETDEKITFDEQVLPACLHTDTVFDEVAEATGWGALGHKKALADTLQSVSLFRFSEEQCMGYYPMHRHLRSGYNHSTQMCYGDVNEAKDTCEGDSGGPLQALGHEQCVYTILGVTSYGRKCGGNGGSGMYTRVNHYVSWIEDIVWPGPD